MAWEMHGKPRRRSKLYGLHRTAHGLGPEQGCGPQRDDRDVGHDQMRRGALPDEARVGIGAGREDVAAMAGKAYFEPKYYNMCSFKGSFLVVRLGVPGGQSVQCPRHRPTVVGPDPSAVCAVE